jgi:glucokinase
MSEKIVLGVDIGGTNTVFGLISRDGRILAKGSLPTTHFQFAPELVEAVSAYTENLISTLSGEFELSGIGIGAPNANSTTGCLEFAPNLNWKGIVPLAHYFSKRLKCEASLTNDARAAALGEMRYGGAKGMKHFFFHYPWNGFRQRNNHRSKAGI